MPENSIVVTSGEPAGVGPDIVAELVRGAFDARLVVIGDLEMLRQRARRVDSGIEYIEYGDEVPGRDRVEVMHLPLAAPSEPGRLDPANAEYVLETLKQACRGCLDGRFEAMVTAPISKEIVNRAGMRFSGHTEYLAELCEVPKPVMLLHADKLRVALATTHLPLRAVADAIDEKIIVDTIEVLDRDLRRRFAIDSPLIKVCGLNPHAGENGYLGREEIDVIIPALDKLRARGIRLGGPYPADTLFTTRMLADADAVLAMYHDQGLPVLKYVGFHNAVNSTLGLPIIRTSVDHGTALDIAGSGRARADSLFAAIDSAIHQVDCKRSHAARA